jgi:hypothetical protein
VAQMKDFVGANEIPIGAQAMRRNINVDFKLWLPFMLFEKYFNGIHYA